MRKKSKRILAAALSAILIWNTCEWQPQALAASSLQRIGAETEADDTAETAEKEATLKKSALKASPSNAEAKDNRCLLYTSPSPRDETISRMPSSD